MAAVNKIGVVTRRTKRFMVFPRVRCERSTGHAMVPENECRVSSATKRFKKVAGMGRGGPAYSNLRGVLAGPVGDTIDSMSAQPDIQTSEFAEAPAAAERGELQRFVFLGASNLTQGFPWILQSLA